MIAGISYKEAKAKMPDECERNGTTSAQLRAALTAFGISTSEKRSLRGKDFHSFSCDAVLHGWAEDEWHWVVWESKRQRVLDPYEPPLGDPPLIFECKSFIKILSAKSN